MIEFIIPAIFTFIIGLILWLIKRERLLLEYNITSSEIFPKDNGNGKYFILNLKNNGNKAVENINYKVSINEGIIESIQFSNDDLIKIHSQENSIFYGNIPLLNPNEELSTTITIYNAKKYSNVTIEARGVGVTASKSKKEQLPSYIQSVLITISIGVFASASFSAYTSLNQVKVNKTIKSIDKIQDTTKKIEESSTLFKSQLSDYKIELNKSKISLEKLEKKIKEEDKKRKQGNPDREQIIFAILNKVGLSKVLPRLLETSGNGFAFWKTGLFIVHSYVIDKKNASKYVNVLIQMSNIDFIAPSSKGFLLYLAGKIEKEEGNNLKSINYYNACKKETPLMYTHLMKQDSFYDLKAIEKEIKKYTKIN